ncbi:MAG: hypothetical protein KBF37_09485 [Saprospiraceae bacterium]|nr:hypothetical protein [Saprospiraceae bacterium]MBP9210538.1 hypothetical protein [Saprospiraceae bacterium]
MSHNRVFGVIIHAGSQQPAAFDYGDYRRSIRGVPCLKGPSPVALAVRDKLQMPEQESSL